MTEDERYDRLNAIANDFVLDGDVLHLHCGS